MAKKEKKNTNKENKNKKSFFKGLKAELKKVIWPTPKQLFNNTVAVITIVLITAAIVFVLDLAFEAINKNRVEKIKEAIESSNTISENTVDENATNENSDETNSVDTNTSEWNSTSENSIENTTSEENATNNGENNSQENVSTENSAE